jgi:hypothetical protein
MGLGSTAREGRHGPKGNQSMGEIITDGSLERHVFCIVSLARIFHTDSSVRELEQARHFGGQTCSYRD